MRSDAVSIAVHDPLSATRMPAAPRIAPACSTNTAPQRGSSTWPLMRNQSVPSEIIEERCPTCSGGTPAASVSVGAITIIVWARNELATCIRNVTPSARAHMGARLMGWGGSSTGCLLLASLRLGGSRFTARATRTPWNDSRGWQMRRWWIVAAGLNGLAAVAAGASVQHLGTDEAARALAETAVRYGLPHAAALLALGALPAPGRRLARGLLAAAGASLTLGTTLFAGTLYALAAGA